MVAAPSWLLNQAVQVAALIRLGCKQKEGSVYSVCVSSDCHLVPSSPVQAPGQHIFSRGEHGRSMQACMRPRRTMRPQNTPCYSTPAAARSPR